jgi:predicted protein tyrosine phosphatase
MLNKAARSGRFLRRAEALAETLRERDPIDGMTSAEQARRDDARLHVLFVCSRNRWRSPTAEQVWRRHPRVDARSAGTSASARHPVSAADLAWADVVVVMEDKHRSRLLAAFRALLVHKPLHVLDIPDDYPFMDPDLVELLRDPVAELLGLDG